MSLLRLLYDRVVIPEDVQSELTVPAAPAMVRAWLASPPEWIHVVSVEEAEAACVSSNLDRGERAAIALAKRLDADLLLIDDQVGRAEARRHGLRVTGTLGVLKVAAEKGHIDVPTVLAQLRGTNFYFDEALLRHVFGRWPAG